MKARILSGRCTNRFACLCVLAAASMLALGCSNGNSGGGPSSAPTDVKSAYFASMNAESWAPIATSSTVTYSSSGSSYTYSGTVPNPSGGQVAFSYTATSNPTVGPWSMTGTLTFTNWVDTTYGYTINGTFALSESESVAINSTGYPRTITVTYSSNLTLAGGTISTLSCNISETLVYSSSSDVDITFNSGSVTADGNQYSLLSIFM